MIAGVDLQGVGAGEGWAATHAKGEKGVDVGVEEDGLSVQTEEERMGMERGVEEMNGAEVTVEKDGLSVQIEEERIGRELGVEMNDVEVTVAAAAAEEEKHVGLVEVLRRRLTVEAEEERPIVYGAAEEVTFGVEGGQRL